MTISGNYEGFSEQDSQGDMMALIWKNNLSVGNNVLDCQHKDLIGMVNSIEHAINEKNSFALLGVIKSFRDSVGIHFSCEARFAQALNFNFEQHDLAHQHLQKELQHTLDQLSANAGIWEECLMDYYPQLLREWLIEHITGEDMKLRPVLKSLPCNFTLD